MLRRFIQSNVKHLLRYRNALLTNKLNHNSLSYAKGKERMLEVNFNAMWQEERLNVNDNEWRVIDTARRCTYSKEAPVLFMLPGTQGTPHIYFNQLKMLQEDIRIISVGYPPIPNAFTLAEEFQHLVHHYKLDQINILGSSLGAYVAQIFTLAHPEKINKLFLGNAMMDARPLVAKRMPSSEFKKLSDEEVLQSILKRISSFPETDERFVTAKDILKETVTKLMTAKELRARFLALDDCGLLPRMRIADKQVVIIETSDDFVVPGESREQLKAVYPNAFIHILPVGGHFPYLTRPEKYTEIIQKNLANNFAYDSRKARL